MEGSENVSSSEYASVTQGSVENDPPYSSGSQDARAWIYMLWICQGYTGFCVNYCILKIHGILCLEFWIC